MLSSRNQAVALMRNAITPRRARSRLFHVGLLTILLTGLAGADEKRTHAVLNLDDGGYAAGDLADSDRPGIIRWQAAGFVSPFEFMLGRVNAVQWTADKEAPKPEGEFCFEIGGGDVVFGSLKSLDPGMAEIDVPRVGLLKVKRTAIRRIYRWRDSADLVYLGPNGLAGWRETGSRRGPTPRRGVVVEGIALDVRLDNAPFADVKANEVVQVQEPEPQQASWRDESGQLITDQEGASIHGDLGIPARATIEFEISWKKKPDFVFALGTSDQPDSVKRAFRFEAWGGDLIVQRELEKEADLAVVQEIGTGPGRAHFQVYLDQEANTITVFSSLGKKVTSLKVGSVKSTALPGVDLTNLRGDVRLEWLRVVRWSGETPREVQADQARIHRSDGSIVYGQVTRFDTKTREFLVKSDSAETRIAPEKISSVFLSLPGDDKPQGLRAVYQNGSRYSGELQKVEKGTLVLAAPGYAELLRLPKAGLRSLVILTQAEVDAPVKDESTGRLEIPGVRLTGKLVDAAKAAGSTCLAWQPSSSATSSPLAAGVSGRIVYKEPPPPPAANQQVTAATAGAHDSKEADSIAAARRGSKNQEREPWRFAS